MKIIIFLVFAYFAFESTQGYSLKNAVENDEDNTEIIGAEVMAGKLPTPSPPKPGKQPSSTKPPQAPAKPDKAPGKPKPPNKNPQDKTTKKPAKGKEGKGKKQKNKPGKGQKNTPKLENGQKSTSKPNNGQGKKPTLNETNEE